jgi:hypothetical protein
VSRKTILFPISHRAIWEFNLATFIAELSIPNGINVFSTGSNAFAAFPHCQPEHHDQHHSNNFTFSARLLSIFASTPAIMVRKAHATSWKRSMCSLRMETSDKTPSETILNIHAV